MKIINLLKFVLSIPIIFFITNLCSMNVYASNDIMFYPGSDITLNNMLMFEEYDKEYSSIYTYSLMFAEARTTVYIRDDLGRIKTVVEHEDSATPYDSYTEIIYNDIGQIVQVVTQRINNKDNSSSYIEKKGEYDELGRISLTKEKATDIDGELLWEYNYEYTYENNVIIDEGRHIYVYNDLQKLDQHIYADNSGYILYKYNDKGDLICALHYSSSGSPSIYQDVYQYNEIGLLTLKYTTRDDYDGMYNHTTYKYDDEGRIESERFYFGDNPYPIFDISYAY